MSSAYPVAYDLYHSYQKKYNETMGETKMHKLMYLVQRESLLTSDQPLFDEAFLGWKYGPVLKSVREEYRKDAPYSGVEEEADASAAGLVQAVLNRYGGYSAWKLSVLSHGESSWKMARRGLEPEDNGTVELRLEDMRMDAAREKMFRKSA